MDSHKGELAMINPQRRSAPKPRVLPRERRGTTAVPNGMLIRQVRERRGLTQEQLAAQAHTNEKRIQRMESGCRCQVLWIEELERVLGVKNGTFFLEKLPEESGAGPRREWEPS